MRRHSGLTLTTILLVTCRSICRSLSITRLLMSLVPFPLIEWLSCWLLSRSSTRTRTYLVRVKLVRQFSEWAFFSGCSIGLFESLAVFESIPILLNCASTLLFLPDTLYDVPTTRDAFTVEQRHLTDCCEATRKIKMPYPEILSNPALFPLILPHDVTSFSSDLLSQECARWGVEVEEESGMGMGCVFGELELNVLFLVYLVSLSVRLKATTSFAQGARIAPYFGRWARVVEGGFLLSEVIGDRALQIAYDNTLYILFGDRRCPATYVNETDEPNARLVVDDLPADEIDIPPNGCWIVASKEIPERTFIHVDYGSEYWMRKQQDRARRKEVPGTANKKRKTSLSERAAQVVDLSRADNAAG